MSPVGNDKHRRIMSSIVLEPQLTACQRTILFLWEQGSRSFCVSAVTSVLIFKAKKINAENNDLSADTISEAQSTHTSSTQVHKASICAGLNFYSEHEHTHSGGFDHEICHCFSVTYRVVEKDSTVCFF